MKLKNNFKKKMKETLPIKNINNNTLNCIYIYNKISDANIKNEMTQDLKLRSTNFEIKKNKRS